MKKRVVSFLLEKRGFVLIRKRGRIHLDGEQFDENQQIWLEENPTLAEVYLTVPYFSQEEAAQQYDEHELDWSNKAEEYYRSQHPNSNFIFKYEE